MIIILYQAAMITQASIVIDGIVLDEQSQPINYATVLLSSLDTVFIKGGVSDEEGRFRVYAPDADTAILKISFVGYQDIVQFVGRGNHQKTFHMRANVQTLSEISITAKKPLVEHRSDRIVMNMSARHSSAGSTALQVLAKAPGLLVNLQSKQISLIGKEGVKVVINGRVLQVSGDLLFNQLEGINAEQIDRIEIIHQPSAKYDAEGTGGIIEIVLKKNQSDGINGSASISGGYGKAPKQGSSLQVNLRKNAFNFYGDFSQRYDKNGNVIWNAARRYGYEGRQYKFAMINDIEKFATKTHTARVGIDWSLSKKNDHWSIGWFGRQ